MVLAERKAAPVELAGGQLNTLLPLDVKLLQLISMKDPWARVPFPCLRGQRFIDVMSRIGLKS